MQPQSILFFSFIFWPRCVACGILAPRPGTEPVPPAVEAWSLNHWTAREVPIINYFNGYIIFPQWMRHHLPNFFLKESLFFFASHSTPFVALQGLQIMTNWKILSRINVLMFFYSKSEFEPSAGTHHLHDSWQQLFRVPSRSEINIAFIPSSQQPTPTSKERSTHRTRF